MSAQPVKISGESTFIFPLLVAQTFAKYREEYISFNQKEADRKGQEWWQKLQ